MYDLIILERMRAEADRVQREYRAPWHADRDAAVSVRAAGEASERSFFATLLAFTLTIGGMTALFHFGSYLAAGSGSVLPVSASHTTLNVRGVSAASTAFSPPTVPRALASPQTPESRADAAN